jgi:hypothetical protein
MLKHVVHIDITLLLSKFNDRTTHNATLITLRVAKQPSIETSVLWYTFTTMAELSDASSW